MYQPSAQNVSGQGYVDDRIICRHWADVFSVHRRKKRKVAYHFQLRRSGSTAPQIFWAGTATGVGLALGGWLHNRLAFGQHIFQLQ